MDIGSYHRTGSLLTKTLLIIWAAVSFGAGIIFVAALNEIYISMVPVGWWFAFQGSVICFVLLVFVYYKLMSYLDRKYGVRD